MKIIVTGGAGFIASHVADAYIAQGHKVVIIDNLLTGFRKNVNPKATFYKADIRDYAAMEKIFKKEKPEVVNHHAAIAEVVKSLRDPIPTLQVNVLGTTNVLMAFGKYGKGESKRFIFSSTGGAIYGEPKKIPADESTDTTPLSPYGLSKLLGEEVIKFYARQYGFTYLIFRYPNVYGPRQNPKGEAGVIAIFGGLMKSGKRPIIFGDGTKARDYTFVYDVARANSIALKKGRNEIINLGWGKKITDQMIFNEIATSIHYKEKPIFAPYRKGEVYQISIKAAKAKKVLGWKPTVALREGIRKTLETIKI
jgi:UDP-glucose 4-epimerase